MQPLASTRVERDVEFGGSVESVRVAPKLSAWVLATWGCVALAVLLPMFLINATPSPQGHVWAFALVVTTVSALRWGWLVADGRRRIYEVSFWVFTYVFLGVAPLVQLRYGASPDTTPRIDTALQLSAMLVVIAGIFAFLLGVSLPAIRPRITIPKIYVVNGVDASRSVLLALAALVFDAYVVHKIGVGTFFSTRDELAHSFDANWPESSTQILVQAGSAMTLLVAFIALVKVIQHSRSREWPLYALCAVVGLGLLVTVNPITAPRYIFGTAALAVAALFGLFGTPTRFRTTAILWVAALLLIFPLADAFRYSAEGDLKLGTLDQTLMSPDFDAFSQVNNAILYVDRHGATNGRQAAGVAMFWVPRRIWPDKPRDTGILLSEDRGYGFSNLSAPLWAELYINGGWLVVLLGMLGFGVVVRALDGRIEEDLQRARAPGVLACILPFYLMILLRGSLLQAMSYLTVILVCVVFVTRWERVGSR